MNVKKIHGTITASELHADWATPSLTIRPFTASDVDFVISRQLALYKSEYGFTSAIWNAYLTEGVHTFVHHFDPQRDCMHILEHEGVPVGCIAITHVDTATAQLRFFFLEPEMRGRGGGHLLMNLAINFCREKKYERVFLWTFSTLGAARHLYERMGFLITDLHENTDWGGKILEERWEMVL